MRPARAFLALALASALAPLAPGAAASVDPAPQRATVRIEFSDLDRAELVEVDRWEGQAARDVEAALDAKWGDGDGRLTLDESAAAADAQMVALHGSRLSSVAMDGDDALVGRALVELARVGDAFETTTRLTLFLAPGPGGHVLTLAPRWNAVVTLVPPEGWRVATTHGTDGSAVVASADEPEMLYVLPAAVATVTLDAPPREPFPVRALVMGASVGGIGAIAIFALTRRPSRARA